MYLKELILVAGVLLLSHSSLYANNLIQCPTVEDIKAGKFHGWLPLTIEYEELASDKLVAEFKGAIEHFEVARWDKSYLENGHCFYQGRGEVFNKIMLAHDAWRPHEESSWSWEIPDRTASCRGMVEQCRFIL